MKRLKTLADQLQRVERRHQALLDERNKLWDELYDSRSVSQREIAEASQVTESRLSQYLTKRFKSHV